MSGSRTKTGCYTCRIRKKKCDEGRPSCLACLSREIPCLGYDVRPSWMLGFRSWQDVLQSEQAKKIRKTAFRNYNLRRGTNRGSEQQHDEDVIPRMLGEGHAALGQFGAKQLTLQLAHGSPSSIESIWWDSNMSSLSGASSFNFRNVMHFVEVICPLQYGFSSLRYHPKYEDHEWLVNEIVENEPLYHAATGLSLCLESGREDGNTSGFCNASVNVRNSQIKSIQGLQRRVDELATARQQSVSAPLRMVSGVLAPILHLLSLEIFNSLGGEWNMHLNAASTILGLYQKPWLSKETPLLGFQPEPDPIRAILTNPDCTKESKPFAFYVNAFVWTDIMANASRRQRAPSITTFEYTAFLKEGLICPSQIMGCHDAIMAAICDINALEAEKNVSLTVKDMQPSRLLQKASLIEQAIGTCLQGVNSDTSRHPSETASADSKSVTEIFGFAALIYLNHVISQEDKLAANVGYCLEKLEALPSNLFIRVCWPFAVAGCMAKERDHDRFRSLVARVIADSQVLGFTWKALIVMEECWRLQLELGGRWCWKTTMDHMGLSTLFI
ncbi:fungal-specific transcription factor domain-containing protein [Xylariaceae sp. FL1272]|nr:fungal-specific transcription factor domain-containing protein [Xylariaceae sp. FL1272]